MNLSLREIQYILTVHAEGSITKAAQVLYIAQPSLSQSIQKIERTLGVQLFSRSGNAAKLTYAGERFVEAGLKIMKLSRDLENELHSISNLDTGRIILGITLYLGSYMFTRIRRVYDELHPGVDIRLMERTSAELEAMVSSGEVDLAILPVSLRRHPGVEYEPLFSARVVLMMAKGHWLENHLSCREGSRFPYIDIRLAENEPFLSGKPGQRINQVGQEIFRRADIQPPIVFQSRSIETVKRLSAAGIGLAFMPDYYHDFIRTAQDATYCYIEDELNPCWDVSMVYQAKSELSVTVREFMRIARQEFGTLE